MANQVLMPRQGNTVESCIILEWKKNEGDTIKEGEVLCEVETDKATFEVESETGGTVLKRFFEEGDDVPVLTPIAVIGEPGEDTSGLGPEGGTKETEKESEGQQPASTSDQAEPQRPPARTAKEPVKEPVRTPSGKIAISPRAKHLAESKGIDYRTVAGTGPGGRIIERDIKYVLSGQESLTSAAVESIIASAMEAEGGEGVPAGGAAPAAADTEGAGYAGKPAEGAFPGRYDDIPVKGVRKVIAAKMAESLSTTAQLTLTSSADATGLLAYRKKLKNSPSEFGVQDVTINDIVMFVVSRILPRFPDMNAHFLGDTIREFDNVHLGFAVDTFKGLMVPVVRYANLLSLKEIAKEAKRLSTRCSESKIEADELTGGTFTVTNLGVLGVESFTPVLNPPEVGILGVCSVQLKPVMRDDEVQHIPHIGLSLTFNHQGTDGAPAARFLKQLCYAIENIELILAQ
jgi:pyruvate dehydrogenase E2 component (dihydrolipoamide acetyltransferase)